MLARVFQSEAEFLKWKLENDLPEEWSGDLQVSLVDLDQVEVVMSRLTELGEATDDSLIDSMSRRNLTSLKDKLANLKGDWGRDRLEEAIKELEEKLGQ